MGGIIPDADIQAAYVEVTTKTPEQIETATAVKWGARALAAMAIATKVLATEGYSPLYLWWYKEAAAFKHEAIEHAGWGSVGLVDAIKQQLAGVP